MLDQAAWIAQVNEQELPDLNKNGFHPSPQRTPRARFAPDILPRPAGDGVRAHKLRIRLYSLAHLHEIGPMAHRRRLMIAIIVSTTCVQKFDGSCFVNAGLV